MVKVFLVDDHEVVRRGLIDLLSADPELEVIGEAGSVAQAMTQIPVLNPDVAVLDVRLPDGNGIELCRDLLSRMPDLRCLMLTSFTSDEAMLDAILAGASGYVVKDIKGMELAKAIKDVGAGRSLLDNRAAAALMVGETVVPGVVGILLLGDTARPGMGWLVALAFIGAVVSAVAVAAFGAAEHAQSSGTETAPSTSR